MRLENLPLLALFAMGCAPVDEGSPQSSHGALSHSRIVEPNEAVGLLDDSLAGPGLWEDLVDMEWTMSVESRNAIAYGITGGVALDHNGDNVMAGMFNYACVFDAQDGDIVVDDHSTRRDTRVVDVVGDEFLMLSDRYAIQWDSGNLWGLSSKRDAHGTPVAGAMNSDTTYVVTATDTGCVLRGFSDELGSSGYDLPASFCMTAELEAAETGEVFMAKDDLWVYDGEDLTVLAEDVGTMLAMDEGKQMLFTSSGGSVVTARDWDGGEVWSVDFGPDASIVELDAGGGSVSAAILVVEGATGHRAEVLSATTGRVAMDLPAGDGLLDFELSGNGLAGALYYDNDQASFVDVNIAW